MNFVVDQKKLRLDRFLAEKVTEVSRSRIQKDISFGLVFVNAKKILEGKFVVRENDKIEYAFEAEQPISAKKLDIKVLFENADILIVDKLAGLVVHPAPGYKGVTLAEGLLYKYKDINLVGDDEIRPGIVHRLDKDTSGAMLVAKNQKTFEYLKNSFAKRLVKKEYVALLAGHLPSKHGFLNDPIGRHSTDFRKMTTIRAKDPKEAATEYALLRHYKSSLTLPSETLPPGQVDEFSLVRVKLHTGRTHQIRVHFSSPAFFGGLPIVGDSLYGAKAKKPFGLERQFLHAEKIEVQLADGSWISAESELPEDLKNVLGNLKIIE